MAATSYPIRTVARLTGIGLDTLRAWERRYQAVTPARGERGRRYSARDVRRLTQLARLVGQGHAIGAIAKLPDAALRKLDVDAGAAGPAAASAPLSVDLTPVLEALSRYHLETVEHALNRYAVLLPSDELVFAVVLPLLREIGRRWAAGTLRPSQEHLASAVVRGVLGALLRTTPRRPATPVIVFATPPGEQHELGLLCGALLAAHAGYSAVHTGPGLPARDIAHAVVTLKARTLVLAATTPLDGSALHPLRRLPGAVDIWIGGEQHDHLRAAIGTRATALSSLEELAQRLGGAQ